MLRPQRRDSDRLFPQDPTARGIARDLFARVEASPVISPHGHVPAATLADDTAFPDPAALFVSTDHYVTRLLHAAGVPLHELGVGNSERSPRAIWRTLADHWHEFAGTASQFWIEQALRDVFEIQEPLSPETAERMYDAIARRLETAAYRPRALFERFRIEVLATTDDPLDNLAAHARIARSGLAGRVLPTFRPDAYLDPDAPGFAARVQHLLAVEGENETFSGYLRALQARRMYFVQHGAVSADHGVVEPLSIDLDPEEADRLFARVLMQSAELQERRRFRAHMLLQMARMSVEDGLVMTVHAGVHRNHSTATYRQYGPDTGHDIPIPTSFVDGLRPILEQFGLRPDFHLVLFTVDETTFSRELAPLAGFYPAVYVGAPWWFLDAPHAIARFRSAVTETAGFYRTSGFIDDTRAFLSIPARHDAARRADAGFLATLVAEQRISLPAAERIIDDLVDAIPRKVFKL